MIYPHVHEGGISSSSIWVRLDPFCVMSLLGAGERAWLCLSQRKVGMAKPALHLPAAFSSLCTLLFSIFGENSRTAGVCSLQGYKVSPGLLRTS